jgi:hypothetical protein
MKWIGGGSATGNAISHSRWPSWCAVPFEISDTEEDVVWSKVGEGAPRQIYDKTSNGLHTFFLYQGYDILFYCEAYCNNINDIMLNRSDERFYEKIRS